MTTSAAVQLLLPVERLVWGDPYKPRTTDTDGKPLTIKNGPDAGKPRVAYDLGYAIDKTPGKYWWDEAWGLQIYTAAQGSNPSAVALAVAEIGAGRDPGKFFAFKIVDGDSTIPNQRGKAPASNENFRGKWVLTLSSAYAPRIVNANGSAAITEPGAVKTGFFIQSYITVKGNESTQSPGIYLNHGYIALSGFGPEILNGPDPTTLGFGAGPLPPGASAVPVGVMNVPATPGAPVVTAPPGAVVTPPGGVAAPAPVLPPATGVVPHTAILQPQTAPPLPVVAAPAAPAPVVVPVAVVRQMTAKAAGATFEQFVANGWTEDAMRQQGYLI